MLTPVMLFFLVVGIYSCNKRQRALTSGLQDNNIAVFKPI